MTHCSARLTLAETCELQRQTRTQMVEELEAVKALRGEATAAVDEARQACVVAHAQATEVRLHPGPRGIKFVSNSLFCFSRTLSSGSETMLTKARTAAPLAFHRSL